MKNSSKINVTVVEATNDTATIRVDLSASGRTLEREILKALKPYRFRLPKNSLVRQGLDLCVKNPALTAGEASRQVCGSDRLVRRIAYWLGKTIVGGSR